MLDFENLGCFLQFELKATTATKSYYRAENYRHFNGHLAVLALFDLRRTKGVLAKTANLAVRSNFVKI